MSTMRAAVHLDYLGSSATPRAVGPLHLDFQTTIVHFLPFWSEVTLNRLGSPILLLAE